MKVHARAHTARKNACLSADRDALFLGIFDGVSRRVCGFMAGTCKTAPCLFAKNMI